MPVTDWQHLVKTFADGLKSMAQGIEALAGRVEEMAQQQNEADAKSPSRKKGRAAAKRPAKKKTAPAPKSAKKKSAKKKAAKAAKAPRGASGVMEQVYEAVRKANGPVRTADIAEQTGLAPKQVTNALYKLKKQKKVESPGKGVYEAT